MEHGGGHDLMRERRPGAAGSLRGSSKGQTDSGYCDSTGCTQLEAAID